MEKLIEQMKVGDYIQVMLVGITIFGWFIVSWFNIRQQKKLIKDGLKLKIYEELYKLKRDVDESRIKLDVLISNHSMTFLKMQILSDNLKSLTTWNEYVKKISENNSKFCQSYRKLWSSFELWEGLMPKLKKSKEILFVERLKIVGDETQDHIMYLMNLSKNEFDKWDQDALKERVEKLQKTCDEEMAYMEDFMTNVYNELVKPLFGHKKKYRENFANLPLVNKVLTKKGIRKKKINL